MEASEIHALFFPKRHCFPPVLATIREYGILDVMSTILYTFKNNL